MRTNLTSKNHTYIPSTKYEIITEPSNFIAAKRDFEIKPKLRVSTKVPRYFFSINIQLTELFNSEVHDSPYSDYTTKYLDKSICNFELDNSYVNASYWKSSDGWTINNVTLNASNNFQVDIEFIKLQWAVYGTQSNTRLSFASFLQHNTSNEAISQYVSIENSVNYLLVEIINVLFN